MHAFIKWIVLVHGKYTDNTSLHVVLLRYVYEGIAALGSNT